MGSLKLRIGRLGEVRSGRIAYSAEMRGLTQNLQQIVGELYSPNCRANLGDARCGVSLGAFTQSGTITNVLAQDQFVTNATQAEDYYTGGKVTWTAGQNNGLSMEVAQYSRGVFYLALPMPYTISAGDTFTAVAGCRKQFTRDCLGKFSNGINFRGEPYVPGNDQLAATGTYKWETTNLPDVPQT
jgi:uncharacterized phage protein (TIGR02218 family)